MASRDSRNEIWTYRRNSRRDDAALASSRFAPTDVAERINWSTIERSLWSALNFSTRVATAQANLNVRSRMSREGSVRMDVTGAQTGPTRDLTGCRGKTRIGLSAYAESANSDQRLHFEFCNLHYSVMVSPALYPPLCFATFLAGSAPHSTARASRDRRRWPSRCRWAAARVSLEMPNRGRAGSAPGK